MAGSTTSALHAVLPFVAEVEAQLFQYYPAATLQRNLIYMEPTVKAFNMSASYANSFGSGAREQVQNWFDQCRVTVPDRSPQFVQLQPAVYGSMLASHSIHEARLYLGMGQGQILGMLLEAFHQNGQQLLFLKNYGAQMTLDNLILGESSKRSDKYLAGQFGEGAKVEINRLIQEGCSVQYWTGNAAWTFGRRVAQGCSVPELHVVVEPGPVLYDFVAVAVRTGADYAGRLLEQQRYLFLQDSYHKLSSPATASQQWSGLELLLDEAHWGKVFVHSIFVADAPTYVRFGLNYIGDKSIFKYLKLGRDRDALDVRLLVFSIPAMLAHIRAYSQPDYQQAIAHIYALMEQPDTELKCIASFAGCSMFADAEEDEQQLAEGLFAHFNSLHQNAVPACSTAGTQTEMDEAGDLAYLGYTIAEVSETAYLLFKRAELLESREQLWERKKQEMLAMPDVLETPGLVSLRQELANKFSKYVTTDQIVFKEMPLGNKHVLRGFTTHFVIDTHILGDMDKVHSLLQASMDSDDVCRQPCTCQRHLCMTSMVDALCRRQHGDSRARILNNVMASSLLDSQYDLNIPPPPVTEQDSAAGQSAASRVHQSHAAGAANADASAAQQPPPEGPTASVSTQDFQSASSGSNAGNGQPVIRIVQDRGTPSVPTAEDPLLFHNGVKEAIALVLRNSAGLPSEHGSIRSSPSPFDGDDADTITVRLCPDRSKRPMESSRICLTSCILPGSEPKKLYFPVGFCDTWSDAKTHKAQDLYTLLEQLHELFLPGVAAVNLYYDADDGVIAFNQGNKLWYNAHADEAYSHGIQNLRYSHWYLTICHELAHNFRAQHDSVFSDYLGHIALQHSKQFHDFCTRNGQMSSLPVEASRKCLPRGVIYTPVLL